MMTKISKQNELRKKKSYFIRECCTKSQMKFFNMINKHPKLDKKVIGGDTDNGAVVTTYNGISI